jgi:hypothetical protein
VPDAGERLTHESPEPAVHPHALVVVIVIEMVPPVAATLAVVGLIE